MRHASLLPLPTAVIHFLTIESYPLYGVFFAFHDYLVKLDMQRMERKYNATEFDFMTNGSVYDMLKYEKDCAEMESWSGNSLENCIYEASTTSIDLPFEQKGFVIFTIPNYLVLVLFLVALLGGLWRLICLGGICWSFGRGKYLRFTWELEQPLWYRLCMHSLAFLVLFHCGIVFFVYVFVFHASGKTYSAGASYFLRKYYINIGIILVALARMKITQEPSLTWTHPDFEAYTFKRSIVKILTDPNDRFGFRLTDALYAADSGDFGRLDKKLASLEDRAKVMNFCRDRNSLTQPLHPAALPVQSLPIHSVNAVLVESP